MNLFGILNDESKMKEISESMDKTLADPSFWKAQEKAWAEIDKQMEQERKSTQMSYERFNRPFTM